MTMELTSILAFVLISPVIVFLLLFNARLPRKWPAFLFLSLCAVLALCFIALLLKGGPMERIEFVWMHLGTKPLPLAWMYRPFSLFFSLIVVLIAALVGCFSLSYMKKDPAFGTYFAYLSLFMAAMLAILAADNLLLLFIFWELVGFSSFLLVGFWNKKKAPVKASSWAFLVNRLADLGFIVALMIVYNYLHTFSITEILQQSPFVEKAAQEGASMPLWAWHATGFGLIWAAFGKSAQLPLSVWLPEAMEGPTPVSALIHAATMVAAGVYLGGLFFPIFSPVLGTVLMLVGSFTAFFCALPALWSWDIKKILAFSTLSQLGYMMAAIGYGHPSAAWFHLSTHAFFKAGLFLGAGAFMHLAIKELSEAKEQSLQVDKPHQDIRNMQGFAYKNPWLTATFLVFAAALLGLPFFTGFLSKELILTLAVDAFQSQGGIENFVGLVFLLGGVFITAAYMVCPLLIFFSKPKESSSRMTLPSAMSIPLVLLAACSVFITFSFHPFSFDQAWWSAFIGVLDAPPISWLPIATTLGMLGLMAIMYKTYRIPREWVLIKRTRFSLWIADFYQIKAGYEGVLRGYTHACHFITKIEDKVLDGFINLLAIAYTLLAHVIGWLEIKFLDAFINGLGWSSMRISNLTAGLQNGRIQAYLKWSLIGIAFFLYLGYTYLITN